MGESQTLQRAIASVRAGRKAEARQLLGQVLQADPRHEQAWLWMGAVVETDAERVRCLQHVLEINPNNVAARKGLTQLQARMGIPLATPQPATPPPTTQCPHCGAMNRAGARFCSGCGQSLEQAKPSPQAQTARCPGCGFDNPAGAQFCGLCGQRLGVIAPSSSQEAHPRQGFQSGPRSKEPNISSSGAFWG